MNVTLFFLGWWSTSHIAVFSLAIALALLLVFPSLAADTSYVYDNASRPRAVIDPASDHAINAYGSVGNLTGITLRPSSTLAVLPFTLSASPIGTTVTIYGTGFSAPLRLQYCEVQHRDRATASTTAMTATVPSGAPTGPVSVTQRVEDLVDQRNSFRKEVAAKQILRTSVEPFE